MKTILISEPSASSSVVYLPYIWGILKTWSEQEPQLDGQLKWLDPIFRRDTPVQSLAPYDLSKVDVLGLSCYVWNFELQCEIAALVKAANPGCLTVAGGPHPQIKDPDFFRKNPYFDVVVTKDGEVTFTSLMVALCRGEKHFNDIPGLYLPDGLHRDMVYTGAPNLPQNFEISPYLAQSEYYSTVIADKDIPWLAAVWETNRGCPYSCSYCDWGSATMSKIRRFDMERVEKEIRWIISNDIDSIISADANLGILPRDVEIVDIFVDAMRISKRTPFLYYSAAKNNPDRALAISAKLMKGGLRYSPTISLQHTDPEVLDSVDRQNISPLKLYDVAKEYLKIGLPVSAQMILGLPGDSYAKWKKCYAQLFEWKLHGDHWVHFFSVLPNAPAAREEYRRKWEIVTIRRLVRDPSASLVPEQDAGIMQEIIVGSRNFTTREWVQMSVYTALIRALHSSGLTQLIALFFRHRFDIDYHRFYERLIEVFLQKEYRGGEIYARAEDIFNTLLEDEQALVDEVSAPQLDDCKIKLCSAHALLLDLAFDIDTFFDELRDSLAISFEDLDRNEIKSVVDYQRNMVCLPSYDPATGKWFAVDHDWPAYFKALAECDEPDAQLVPAEVSGMRVLVNDLAWETGTYSRLPQWMGLDGPDRWQKWAMFSRETGQTLSSILHQNVRLASAPIQEQVPDNGVPPGIRSLAGKWLPEPVKAGIRRAASLVTSDEPQSR